MVTGAGADTAPAALFAKADVVAVVTVVGAAALLTVATLLLLLLLVIVAFEFSGSAGIYSEAITSTIGAGLGENQACTSVSTPDCIDTPSKAITASNRLTIKNSKNR